MSMLGGLAGVVVGLIGSKFQIAGVAARHRPLLDPPVLRRGRPGRALLRHLPGGPRRAPASHRRPPIRMSDHDPMPQQHDYDDPDLELVRGRRRRREDGRRPAAAPRQAADAGHRRRWRRSSLVAGGFIGGVQVQKGQDGNGDAAARAAARRAAGFAARFGGAARARRGRAHARAAARRRQRPAPRDDRHRRQRQGLDDLRHDTDGTTVKIRTNDNSKVTRNASAAPSARPSRATRVVVQGAKSVERDRDRVVDHRDRQGRRAFGGLGGAPRRRRAPPGATRRPARASSSVRGSGGVPQGFAPPRLGRRRGDQTARKAPSAKQWWECRTSHVTGHRNPDTDSIAAAIGYAELRSAARIRTPRTFRSASGTSTPRPAGCWSGPAPPSRCSCRTSCCASAT